MINVKHVDFSQTHGKTMTRRKPKEADKMSPSAAEAVVDKDEEKEVKEESKEYDGKATCAWDNHYRNCSCPVARLRFCRIIRNSKMTQDDDSTIISLLTAEEVEDGEDSIVVSSLTQSLICTHKQLNSKLNQANLKQKLLVCANKTGHLEDMTRLLFLMNDDDVETKAFMNTTFMDSGYVDARSFLLAKQGVDKDETSNSGIIAFIKAAKSGHLGLLLLLLEQGVEVNKTDEFGTTALMGAASMGHREVLKCLLEQGAEVNKTDEFGETALTVAASNGDLDVLRQLLEQGAEIDTAGYYGKTALMYATNQGHRKVLHHLLEQGAEVDKVDDCGRTALMIAADCGHVDAARCLVEQGADVNKADSTGWTALHSAAYQGCAEIVTMLMASGASLTARTTDGELPTDGELTTDGELPTDGHLPIDVAANDAIRGLIHEESIRRSST